MIWASGQVNADIPTIEKAIQASGSKMKMTTEDLKACVTEIQGVLVAWDPGIPAVLNWTGDQYCLQYFLLSYIYLKIHLDLFLIFNKMK